MVADPHVTHKPVGLGDIHAGTAQVKLDSGLLLDSDLTMLLGGALVFNPAPSQRSAARWIVSSAKMNASGSAGNGCTENLGDTTGWLLLLSLV